MKAQPYLLFDGRCEEALDYYRRALGAEVTMLLRMKDNPDMANQTLPAELADKVLHCSFRIGETDFSASDGNEQGMSSFSGKPDFGGFQLLLATSSDTEATQRFAALSDGGRVFQPLIKTFFSPRFGMVADRFGLRWMVMVAPPMNTQ